MKNSFFEKTWVRIPLALACCILWGAAVLLLKVGNGILGLSGTNAGSLMLFAGTRFILAGFLIVLAGAVSSGKWELPERDQFPAIILVAFFMTSLQYFLYYTGNANTTGIKCSVITGSASFMIILVSCLIFRQERLTRIKMLSCAIGFAGILICNIRQMDFRFSLVGEGFILLSSVSGSVGNCLIKKYSERISVANITGYQYIVGGSILSLAGLLLHGSLRISSLPAWGIFLALVMITFLAQLTWSTLLKYNDVSKVGIFYFAIPISGTLLSALFLPEETVNFATCIALALITVGILLANLSSTSKE